MHHFWNFKQYCNSHLQHSDRFARQLVKLKESFNTRGAIVVLTTIQSVISFALYCYANPASLQNQDLELLGI